MHGLGYVTPDMVRNNRDNMTGNGNYISEDQLTAEIDKYNPCDGLLNRQYIQDEMNISTKLSEYIDVIRDVTRS